MPGFGCGHPEVMPGDIVLRREVSIPISDQVERAFDSDAGLLAAAERFEFGQKIGGARPGGRQLFSKSLTCRIVLPTNMVVDEAGKVLIKGIKKPDQRMRRVSASR